MIAAQVRLQDGLPGLRFDNGGDFMRKEMGIYGTIVLGMTALASSVCLADDKDDVGIGPIDSIHDLQDTAKMLFKLADTNNDGQISQKEATDAGNLLVGGFFFRADANGDGVLTTEEAMQARDSLFAQQPLLKLVLERAKPTNAAPAALPQPAAANDRAKIAENLAKDPVRTVGSLLDSNHDQKIEATELRQAVTTGVQSLFTLADTNQDGQLTPYELNAAVGEVAKSATQTVFQAADADRNNLLSMDEFDKALVEPAHAFFRVIDANGDNQLSFDELQRAGRILADQLQRLRVPEPENSMSRKTQRRNTAQPTGAQSQQTTTTTGGSVAPAPAPR
jgi:Ca2+-binding EF-hand superfamily protein